MKRTAMIAIGALAIATIGIIVLVGCIAAQGLVFMLEIASKVTEELR